MDDNKTAGPSTPKKTKMSFTNDEQVTEDELEGALYEIFSEDDSEYVSSSDDLGESSDSNEDTDEEMLSREADADPPPDTASTANDQTTTPTWSATSTGRKNFVFSKINELLVPIPGNEPIDYFKLLVDDTFLHLIVEQTNFYAEEAFHSEASSELPETEKWKPLTCHELRIFIALVLHTGPIKFEKLDDYWKVDPLFDLKIFAEHMSRDRFMSIMRCLHFAPKPTAGEEIQDRLFKIRPVVDFFNRKMSDIYCPRKQLSLEFMVLCHSRLIFDHYIKRRKRHSYGIKFYTLTESNDITLKIRVYTGRLDSFGGRSHSREVVMDLMKDKLNLGHSLFMLDFFNSYQLAEELQRNQTYCTGILRKGRKGNSAEVVSAKIAKGETIARYTNGIMQGKWKDKHFGNVMYISTEYENDMVEYTNLRYKIKKDLPLPIMYYNKYIGAEDREDREDQMLWCYPCGGITLRWYKKVFLHVLQLLLLNSYFLYRKYSGRKISLYKFRIAVLEELLGTKAKKKEPKVTNHYPTKISITNDRGETQRKRCRMCHKNKVRKLSLYECEVCPGKPGLCPGKCFVDYHSQ